MLRIDVALPVAKCCRRVQKQRRSVPPRREPRISRLMALAIEFSDMLDRGDVADLTELATVAQVTQPRITQILNLTHLAPDIQEDLLFLDPPSPAKNQSTNVVCVRSRQNSAGSDSGHCGRPCFGMPASIRSTENRFEGARKMLKVVSPVLSGVTPFVRA